LLKIIQTFTHFNKTLLPKFDPRPFLPGRSKPTKKISVLGVNVN